MEPYLSDQTLEMGCESLNYLPHLRPLGSCSSTCQNNDPAEQHQTEAVWFRYRHGEYMWCWRYVETLQCTIDDEHSFGS